MAQPIQYPSDLSAPGAVERLLAFHAAQFGPATMTADPGQAQPGPTTGGNPQPAPGTPSHPQGSPVAPATVPAGGPEARMADLVRERERRQNAERELAQLREAEATRQREGEAAETARVRTELEQRNAALEAQLSSALAGRTLDQARISATAAGVDPNHVDTFLRLVDLTSISVRQDGSLDAEAINSAVAAGLEAAPMFKPPLPGGQRGARRAAPGSGAGATPAPAGDLAAKVAAQVAVMQQHLGGVAAVATTPANTAS